MRYVHRNHQPKPNLMNGKMMGSQRVTTALVTIAVAFMLAVLVGNVIRSAFDDVAAELDRVKCEQWGGRFADPCENR